MTSSTNKKSNTVCPILLRLISVAARVTWNLYPSLGGPSHVTEVPPADRASGAFGCTVKPILPERYAIYFSGITV